MKGHSIDGKGILAETPRCLVYACFAALLAFGQTAVGTVTYSAQSRTITATGSSPAIAPDFGLFNQTVSGSGGPSPSATASASQDSSLLYDRVTFSGALATHGGQTGSTADASSTIDVTFSVDVATDYAFSFALTNFQYGGGVSVATATLSSAPSGTTVFSGSVTEPPNPLNYSVAGTVAPGTYRFVLTLSMNASGLAFSDSFSYSGTLFFGCVNILNDVAYTQQLRTYGSVALVVDVRGDPTSYQWQKDGAPLDDNAPHLSGAHSPSLMIHNASTADEGDYQVVVAGNCGSETSSPATLDVLPPCPGDFNHDGNVTVNDILVFLAAWFGHAPAADVNGDGSITVQDIFDFLAAWFAGC